MATIPTSDLKAGDRIATCYVRPTFYTVTGPPRLVVAGDPMLPADDSMGWAVGGWWVPVTSTEPRNIETQRGYALRMRRTIETVGR